MADEKRVIKPQGEQKGFVTDVVVPIAQGVAGGAAGAWTTAKIGQGKQPPPPSKKE